MWQFPGKPYMCEFPGKNIYVNFEPYYTNGSIDLYFCNTDTKSLAGKHPDMSTTIHYV